MIRMEDRYSEKKLVVLAVRKEKDEGNASRDKVVVKQLRPVHCGT